MEIVIKYVHAHFNLGFEDVRNVWLLSKEPVKLSVSVHQGNLVYRLPNTGQRISYKQLKKGLTKKRFVISIPELPLPF